MTVADGGEALVGVVSTRRIIAAAVVVQAAISFAEQGIPTLAVFLEDDLALSATAVGALVAMLGLGRLVSFYAAGRAVDRRGERRVLLVGALGTGVCVALASGAGYTTMLVVFFVAGLFLATAPAYAIGLTLLFRWNTFVGSNLFFSATSRS